MKIALLGHKGSIGSRYAAILTHLGVDWVGYDIAEKEWVDAGSVVRESDGVIVATPTDDHVASCVLAHHYKKPILCEKPISKSLEEFRLLSNMNLHVVNNYQFCVGKRVGMKMDLSYNYFKTGKDGLWWDVCQILYLDPQSEISTTSPLWNLWSSGELIPYRNLEYSYVTMIMCWLNTLGWNHLSDYGPGWLWTVEDARKMTEVVLERIKREGAGRNPSSK